MAFRLKVSLRNRGSSPVTATIHPGTIFEVVDPFSGTQNLAAVGATQVTVQPGRADVVEIDAWCLNRTYSPPANTQMRLTGLRLTGHYADQREVWNDLDSRR